MNSYSSSSGVGNSANTMNVVDNTANIATAYVCGGKTKEIFSNF